MLNTRKLVALAVLAVALVLPVAACSDGGDPIRAPAAPHRAIKTDTVTVEMTTESTDSTATSRDNGGTLGGGG